MTSLRAQLEAQLKTDWATIPALAGVRVIATEAQLDTPTQPTLLLRVKRVGKSPAAAMSHRRHEVLATLISSLEDVDQAMDQLDDLLEAALGYFDTRYLHGGADVVGYGAERLAVDIPLSVIHPKA
jgi:hypothetical protein